MKIYTLAILFLFFHCVTFGQKLESVKSAPLLVVEVEGGKSLKLTDVDLAKLPRRELKVKDPHDGKEASYSGVDLREILLLGGAKLGTELRGAQLAAYVQIDAADGYKGVFGIAELDLGFTEKLVILADKKDSLPLPKTHGPWQVIVPDEKRAGRWVRQVVSIRLRLVK